MRRSNAFFAIFILLLSLAPCADAWESSTCESEGVCESSNEEGQTNEADECLPFCSCMCCTTLTIAPFQAVEPAETLDAVDDLILGEAAYSPPAFDIWQPPKI